MISGVVARRYAKALFELAADERRVQPIGEELSRLKSVLAEVPELGELLANPAFTRAERKGIADETLRERLALSDSVRNLVAILIDNGRVRGIGEIADRYREMADEAAGRAEVLVKSAGELSEADRGRIAAGLSGVTGKQVTVSVEVDPSLIGGLSARVGGLVFDGSIRAQLEALEEELKGASS
jgi:F-type H+-transporting ATPase subunit delta